MGLIVILSSQKQLPNIQKFFINADKIAHFGVYFVLGVLISIAVISNSNKSNLIKIIIISLIGIFFAISDEFHQYYVPNRTPDVFDFIADIIGIVFSLFLFSFIKKVLYKYINE